MSRSNNTEVKNPAVKFFQWEGEKGGFKYFDKSKGEKGENVHIPLPYKFLALDTLSTIRGWDDSAGSGYWSNEVRNIKTDILTVRNKNGICATGTYDQVLANRACSGARYSQSVYVAYKGEEGLEISSIQMMGAALGSWIEFCKKNKIYQGAIEVSEMVEGKKGKTVYQIPVFKKIETSEATNEIAKDLDKELQEYLTKYFNSKKVEIDEDSKHDIYLSEEEQSAKEYESRIPKETSLEYRTEKDPF